VIELAELAIFILVLVTGAWLLERPTKAQRDASRRNHVSRRSRP
jgi:hypothetical protein